MKNKNIIETIIEILILVIMIKPMFNLSFLTGLGFLFAIAGSVKDMSLFTKPNMGRYIVGGTILTYTASLIFFSGINSGEWISFIIILFLALTIWFKGFFLKKGIQI